MKTDAFGRRTFFRTVTVMAAGSLCELPSDEPGVDPVEEIYRLREEHAAKFNYNIRAMFEELKKDEARLREQGYKFVDFTKKKLPQS